MINKKRALSRPVFALAALLFVAIAGLGFFRFNASQLEYRLNGIEKNIDSYSLEENELKQTLSGLTSPIRIYSYCKDKLGMSTAKQETVRVRSALAADVTASAPQQGWRSSLFSFFGFTMNGM